jgi:uncharacterized damage-inducible protein DinB
MKYAQSFLPDNGVPKAANPMFQHAVDSYASEINKTAQVWLQFEDEELAWKPHEKSSCVGEIMRHQLLSERRFFAEFLGSKEPAAGDILPASRTAGALVERYAGLSVERLSWLASVEPEQWLAKRPFFGEERERIWIFWRRVLHTAHHRTQLTVYLRILGKPVPSTYGPTADVTWDGADPTTTVEAAGRG